MPSYVYWLEKTSRSHHMETNSEQELDPIEIFVRETLYATYKQKCREEGIRPSKVENLVVCVRALMRAFYDNVGEHGVGLAPYNAANIDGTFSCIAQARGTSGGDMADIGIIKTDTLADIRLRQMGEN